MTTFPILAIIVECRVTLIWSVWSIPNSPSILPLTRSPDADPKLL